MGQREIVSLMSDFGASNAYVGIMKGVMAAVNPRLTMIDLTHAIPPQDVAAGRFALMSAAPYFPEGTVYVAVVDPGVGSARRAIALSLGTSPAFPDAFFVGPDNGLCSGLVAQQPIIAAVELTNPDYWRTPVPSPTFHGRDIFAPVGAHLASGISLASLGTAIAPETLTPFPLTDCTSEIDLEGRTTLQGCIQAIDHFGNLITNIPAAQVQERRWTLTLGDRTLPSHRTYSDVATGEALTLVGSHGWIEIAICCGNAQQELACAIGDAVTVSC